NPGARIRSRTAGTATGSEAAAPSATSRARGQMGPSDDAQRSVTNGLTADLAHQRVDRLAARVAADADDVRNVRRDWKRLPQDLHVRLQVALAQQRYAEAGRYPGGDTCGARAFENRLEHGSALLPDIEGPS